MIDGVIMGRPRYPKPDKVQPQMVEDLRTAGYCCIITHPLGGDALDFFCGGWHHDWKEYTWVQVEAKSPGGTLTPDEEDYLARWPDLPIIVAGTAEKVLGWFGAL